MAEQTPYMKILAQRKKEYAAHIKEMTIDPTLLKWAARMETKFGKTVKVWHNQLPWLEALMVVRYGEAVDGVDDKGKPIKHWPKATTIADYGRAMDWESGAEIPYAVERAKTMTLEG